MPSSRHRELPPNSAVPDSEHLPVCTQHPKMFASTSLKAHAKAVKYCRRCPFQDWCKDQLAWARQKASTERQSGRGGHTLSGTQPSGTWAGKLLGRDKNDY